MCHIFHYSAIIKFNNKIATLLEEKYGYIILDRDTIHDTVVNWIFDAFNLSAWMQFSGKCEKNSIES